MSDLLENYLDYLSEDFKDKFLNFLADIGIMIGPVGECKKILAKDKYIYLYHGTRPEYVKSIKKNGLSLKHFKKRTKDEGDVLLGIKPRLFFGNVFTGKQAGFGSVFDKYGIKYLLAKLDVRYLKIEFGGFVYTRDVPPKDIIWDDDPKFHNIGKQSKCLIQYGKGKRR